MIYDVLTTLPEFFGGPLATSIVGRARDRGVMDVRVWNLRGWALDRHRTTDDYPFGGGAGMVMKADPVVRAVEDLARREPPATVVLPSPQGERLTHGLVVELAACERLLIVCGHYEGIDERVTELVVDREVSVGDYVLTGGEIAALVLIDATCRLVPGVLGTGESAEVDSFAWDGLLDCPHYTRPREYRELTVPDVLLSGNHGEIAKWRRREAVIRTARRRPDLLAEARLSDEERALAEGILRQGS
jgi:tRNA (guanine37-N1)-methyltransferase